MSSSPPPPYSLRPPPYVRPRGQRKPPPPTSSRPSSRELLTEALRRAQHAVNLDSNESVSDVPAAIAAYDAAIGLLKRVIERRSQRPGNASEVERVRDIHDRYVERARELCVIHSIPMPSHVVPTPPPTFASAEDPPSKMKKPKTPSHPPLPVQQQRQQHTPPNIPPLTRTAFIRRLKLKHQRSHTTVHNDDDDDDSDNNGDDHDEDNESEQGGPPSLSSPSSSSLTIETRSPISPVDNDIHDLPHDDDRRWISSAACDEELKEWGRYLDEAGENRRRRLSGTTAASSTGWSAIAVSCGDCVH